jgi:hypothetical protein
MSVFQRFDRENDIVENQRTTVSSGLWSGGSGTLTTFFTASADATAHVKDVYKTDPASDTAAEVQFAIGYAHSGGSGSLGNTTDTTAGNRESAALYRQFANILLAPNTDKFTFTGASATSDDFYFISFQRARMREKIDPGNWELNLGSGSALLPAGHRGDAIRLIDDSSTNTSPDVNEGGRVFNVVSGSVADGVAVAATAQGPGAYGLFYPDLGLILLNPATLVSASIVTSTSTNANDNNSQRLFNAITSGSGTVGTGKYFAARREEEISSTSYFVRVNNKKFNFSSNPTFFTSSDGSFTQGTFFKDPKTFITQVGLYNDSDELLAIAKLSKPLLNSYAREAIIKVKLDF